MGNKAGRRLSNDYDVLSERGLLDTNIPAFIVDNLNPRFKLRPYQKEAIARFIYYFEKDRKYPVHLLFNMATGSGKTLIMASLILFLYKKGYRNFLFFVNSNNIIEKTRNNFLNKNSSKYLFSSNVVIDGRKIEIREVPNFDFGWPGDINIVFTTIQGLHSLLNGPRENAVTFEDFAGKRIVLLSDEAHHINAWTKKKLHKKEEILKNSWEHTVLRVLNSNLENILLEFTATIGLDDPAIFEKYREKLIFEYDLKRFRIDGYSKEIKVLQSDLGVWERMLQAVILSQYRRKVAAKHRLAVKPVVLFKSKTIRESKEHFDLFLKRIRNLSVSDLESIRTSTNGTILEKVFDFLRKENISLENFVFELREDFSGEHCLLLDSENIDFDKQLLLNSLEEEENRVRAIFAVKMLDEGWDVLNLFDIVRLYDTRDGRWTRDGKYVPGNTTIAERQLIGRGARYYPFKIKDDDDPFKRKFDKYPEHKLRILEELYYHSKHNPRYIQEITSALKDVGLMPREEKEIILKVKPSIKNTDFWNKGVLFVNKKEKVDRLEVKTLQDLNIQRVFKFRLASGISIEKAILEDQENTSFGFQNGFTNQIFKLKDFGKNVIRKAMNRNDFYCFNNLKKYFPGLRSSAEFIVSLGKISVEISSTKDKLEKMNADDKLLVCLSVLNELKKEITEKTNFFTGTRVFVPLEIKKIVKDKRLRISVGKEGTQEYGVPMVNAKSEDLRLDLSKRDWYVFDENYGTREEKSFVKFIDGLIDELKEKYCEIYLLRNANLFRLYDFIDGRALEPDFVLFLKKKDSETFEQYQLFVEAKGEHLRDKDSWKEKFLQRIEKEHKINGTDRALFAENPKYLLIGLPFYSESQRNRFLEIFRKKFLLL